jgi:hypothetical protein
MPSRDVVSSVAMLQGSGRKLTILEKCRKLKTYLASEPQIGLAPYLQDLGAIEQRVREAKLVNLLQERDRGNGTGTIDAQRWERFFGGDDAV